MLIFDIETEPIPDEQLLLVAPAFAAPPHPGEFDPAAVKYGNTKDENKRAAILTEKQQAHAALVANYEAAVTESRVEWWAGVKGKAALSATTGRVLAIGYYSPEKGKVAIDAADAPETFEATVVSRFWNQYAKCRAVARSMVGLNIIDFDLPFLIRRSFILGIDVPPTAMEQWRYPDKIFVDLRKIWLCGQSSGSCSSSFGHLAAAFGTAGKPDGVGGADFARLWRGTPEERKQAAEYLENDLRQPAEWAKRMGIFA